MSDQSAVNTVQVLVRNESFELPLSLLEQLVPHSSSPSRSEPISIDVDPCFFTTYLLYLQSNCFIRPRCLTSEDLLDGLHTCDAPLTLVEHCERWTWTFTSSSHQSTCDPTTKPRRMCSNALISTSLIVSVCLLSIDLYRQMFIFNDKSPQALTVVVYLIDGALFLYSSGHAISKLIGNAKSGERCRNDLHLLVDVVSCLGVLSYLTSQRSTHWNSFGMFVHLCRTARVIQLGYHLVDVQWCLWAISRCLHIGVQAIFSLLWIFLLSGSILYLIDVLEKNEQYSSLYTTILSAHETLFTIGYRNNAPYGRWTRVWTMVSIYFLSSVVQIVCWWFQSHVTMHWKKLFVGTGLSQFG